MSEELERVILFLERERDKAQDREERIRDIATVEWVAYRNGRTDSLRRVVEQIKRGEWR